MKRKVQIPVVKQMKIFPLKCVSRIIFYFSKFYHFKLLHFSKNQLFGELFQKRFTGGICDLGGHGTDTAANPIRMYSVPGVVVHLCTS